MSDFNFQKDYLPDYFPPNFNDAITKIKISFIHSCSIDYQTGLSKC